MSNDTDTSGIIQKLSHYLFDRRVGSCSKCEWFDEWNHRCVVGNSPAEVHCWTTDHPVRYAKRRGEYPDRYDTDT